MRVEQRFATVEGRHARALLRGLAARAPSADGDNPTLLYGYGGFEVSHAALVLGRASARAWHERGGVLRAWPTSAAAASSAPAGTRPRVQGRTSRRSYDDFIAVAEDLIARKITSPRHLGIQGGSNGGLLVGAVMLQRPELFNAVVCQVPLLDMQRYHKLLAGASWMAEYGDPDEPDDWACISQLQPVPERASRTRSYPRVLFTTSTRDDRVHPGHARKMAARMLRAGPRRAVLREHRRRPRRRGRQRAARRHDGAGVQLPWQQLAAPIERRGHQSSHDMTSQSNTTRRRRVSRPGRRGALSVCDYRLQRRHVDSAPHRGAAASARPRHRGARWCRRRSSMGAPRGCRCGRRAATSPATCGATRRRSICWRLR